MTTLDMLAILVVQIAVLWLAVYLEEARYGDA